MIMHAHAMRIELTFDDRSQVSTRDLQYAVMRYVLQFKPDIYDVFERTPASPVSASPRHWFSKTAIAAPIVNGPRRAPSPAKLDVVLEHSTPSVVVSPAANTCTAAADDAAGAAAGAVLHADIEHDHDHDDIAIDHAHVHGEAG